MDLKKFEDYKNDEKLNERYKPATEFVTINGFKIGKTNYVDEAFDSLVQILCDVNMVSEKDFTGYDNTRNYVEMFFDNNQEVLIDIDNFKDKRRQYCGEFLYDKYFNNEKTLNELKNNK